MVQFASYLRRVLCKTRLIFPRINGPYVLIVKKTLKYLKTNNSHTTQQDKKPQLTGGKRLAIYNRCLGSELETSENKSCWWPARESKPGPPACESDALTT